MLLNAIALALREIRRNVLRSTLTMLGIIIGVAAVITMVSIGKGATAQVTSNIESMGSNLLVVRTGQGHRGTPGVRTESKPFELKDSDAMRAELAGVAALAPAASERTVAIYGNVNWNTTVTGTDNDYFKALGWSFKEGRAFEDSEMRSGAAVCVIGSSVAKELFGALAPIGASIRLQSLSCIVIGVLESKGQSNFGSDRDDTVVMPIKTLHRRMAGNQDVSVIYISASSSEATSKVKSDAETLMRQLRGMGQDKEDDFHVRDMRELAAALTSTTMTLTALLGAVAAVSMIVGGIGIMNIMLVSVTERTREIGIRLAIGALERDVMRQFLVEATVLSSIGGLLGVALGIGSAYLGAKGMRVPFVLDVNIAMLSFAFSALVGVFFGYYPARKAASLNPIEALRHE